MASKTPRAERSSQRAPRATSESGPSAASPDREGGERAAKRAVRTPERSEEFGPLEVRRHRKDDGRALLLYELRDGSR
jgi:hypothetical protein